MFWLNSKTMENGLSFITFQNKASNSTDTVYIERQRQEDENMGEIPQMFDFMSDTFGIRKVHLKTKPKR